MKIKSKKKSAWVAQAGWVAGILILIFLLSQVPAILTRVDMEKSPDAAATPDSILRFVEKEHSFVEVLDYFREYYVFLSVKYDASVKMSEKIRHLLEQKGSRKIKGLGFQDSYVAALKKGKIAKERLRGKSPAIIRYKGFKIFSAGDRVGNYSKLEHKGKTVESLQTGLIVYVCNPKNRDVFQYTFDYHKESKPLSKGHRGSARIKELETIEIVLSDEHYERLRMKREEALDAQILLTSEEDFVPAKIFHQDQKYKISVRLKGDWTDHLSSDKWSFRFKLKGGKTLHGMRKFSLHHPKARNYAGEWLFHQLLADAGILNLQYLFVQVQLRVIDQPSKSRFLGIYAMEEAFDKHLAERNQRREGVILKIDEGPVWHERTASRELGLSSGDLEFIKLADHPNLNVLPFGEKKTLRDSTLSRYFKTARELFLSYFMQELPASEVFDVALLAKYNAICNLLGAEHALITHNFRVYYNPISSRLEPIGFDANACQKIWHFSMYHLANKDLAFMEAYAAALEEVSSLDYLNTVLNYGMLEEKVNLLKREFKDYKWDPGILKHNRSILQMAISPSKCLNVFLEKYEGDELSFSIENFGRFPVRIIGLQKIDSKFIGKADENNIIRAMERKTIIIPLDKNFRRLFVHKKQKKAQFDLYKDIWDIQLLWKILGAGNIREAAILPWEKRLALTVQSDPLRQKPNADKFDFLVIDEVAKTITCKPGLWQLQESLIIPKGYIFRAGPACIIELQNFRSKIISFSPVHFEGSAQYPFELRSSSNKGQGLLVMETKDTSLLHYCKFTKLSSPSTKAWVITGAVNFYHAPVKIHNTTFTHSRSEDALNIIHSWFDMDNVVFSNTHSDAFDGDFVNGSIRNTTFIKSGNDAIDVSGSRLFIENVVILEAGDKGLSAGESSIVRAKHISIINSEIAVASKDKSELVAEDMILQNNKLGFTAFQKKSESGASHILAREVQMKGNQLDYLIEINSSLQLNGQRVESTTGVVARLYGAEFGKSSN